MSDFEKTIEFLCREICKELGENPDALTKKGCIDGNMISNWKRHQSTVTDWLEMEAFSRIKQNYWNGKYKGQEIEKLLPAPHDPEADEL